MSEHYFCWYHYMYGPYETEEEKNAAYMEAYNSGGPLPPPAEGRGYRWYWPDGNPCAEIPLHNNPGPTRIEPEREPANLTILLPVRTFEELLDTDRPAFGFARWVEERNNMFVFTQDGWVPFTGLRNRTDYLDSRLDSYVEEHPEILEPDEGPPPERDFGRKLDLD